MHKEGAACMLGVWSVVSVSSSALGARFTVSLAERLALRGVRVLLFELAPELPSLDVLLGVSEKVVYTLADAREVTPERVLLTPCENLYFAPLGVGETVDEPATAAHEPALQTAAARNSHRRTHPSTQQE